MATAANLHTHHRVLTTALWLSSHHVEHTSAAKWVPTAERASTANWASPKDGVAPNDTPPDPPTTTYRNGAASDPKRNIKQLE